MNFTAGKIYAFVLIFVEKVKARKQELSHVEQGA
jgi:hypothetical protein